MWGEFRRTRANTNRGQPRRPARSEQNTTKKFSFPFRRKNRARAHQEKRRKLFCGVASVSSRRRGGFLCSGIFDKVGSSEVVKILQFNLCKKLMKIFRKLIRDKIPEMMRREGKKPIIRTLEEKEYIEALERKLIEEVQEMRQGDDPKEKIAYLYEILDALIAARSFSKEVIAEIQQKKRDERGGFSKHLFLEGIEGKN